MAFFMRFPPIVTPVSGPSCWLKQRVNKWRNRRSAAEHHQGAEHQEDQKQRQEPEFLPLFQKTPQVFQELHIRFLLGMWRGFLPYRKRTEAPRMILL
jgi:hypothetical protein